MKAIETKKVRQVLKDLGFKPVPGKANGHALWQDSWGRCCRPVLRSKEIGYAVAFSLGLELENKGICNRQQFLLALKNR